MKNGRAEIADCRLQISDWGTGRSSECGMGNAEWKPENRGPETGNLKSEMPAGFLLS
jgi:hypothetical protein